LVNSRLFIALILLLSASTLIAQKDKSSFPFQDGEQITYVVYYNLGFFWMPAGEVRFSVTEQDTTFHFDVIGKSFDSYDSVFKVRDSYSSVVDKETFLPSMFKRDVMEGNYIRFDSISFSQQEGTLEEYFGKSRDQANPFYFDLDNVVQDMLSAIYHVRSVPEDSLAQEANIPVSIFFDKELFDLNIKCLGRVSKKIRNLGKVETYHLQPELIAGSVFEKDDLMDIWVSADDNRIPLLIESPITVGSVKAVLSSAKGLKNQKCYLE